MTLLRAKQGTQAYPPPTSEAIHEDRGAELISFEHFEGMVEEALSTRLDGLQPGDEAGI